MSCEKWKYFFLPLIFFALAIFPKLKNKDAAREKKRKGSVDKKRERFLGTIQKGKSSALKLWDGPFGLGDKNR